jgi:hypothetical protein
MSFQSTRLEQGEDPHSEINFVFGAVVFFGGLFYSGADRARSNAERKPCDNFAGDTVRSPRQQETI